MNTQSLSTKNPVSAEMWEFYRRGIERNHGSTHYEGCWRDHWTCALERAVEEIDRLQHYITTCGGSDNDGRCPMPGLAGIAPETSAMQDDPPWDDDPENPKNQMAKPQPCSRCAAAEADFQRVHHNCIHARAVAARALKLLERIVGAKQSAQWCKDRVAVRKLARSVPPMPDRISGEPRAVQCKYPGYCNCCRGESSGNES